MSFCKHAEINIRPIVSWNAHQGELPVRCALGLSSPALGGTSVRKGEKCFVWVRGWLKWIQHLESCVMPERNMPFLQLGPVPFLVFSFVSFSFCLLFFKNRVDSEESLKHKWILALWLWASYLTCLRICFSCLNVHINSYHGWKVFRIILGIW